MATFLQNIDLWRSTLAKLELEISPIGVKYCTRRPVDLERLEHQMALCEMIKFAQIGNAFYASPEDHACDAGLRAVGGPPAPRAFESGDLGATLGGYEEARCMRRYYDVTPTLARDTIDSIAFAPLASLTFEPDLLVVASDTMEKTSIVLRSLVYKTGRVWDSKSTLFMNCAWLYVYPFLSGQPNFVTTGVSVGMSRRRVIPAGYQLISIPYDVLPTMLESLQDMPWVLSAGEGDEVMARAKAELGLPPDPRPFFLR